MQKENKIVKLFVIVLLVLLFGTIGYIVYDKVIVKEEMGVEKDKNNKNKEVEITDNDLKESLLKKVEMLELIANLNTEIYRSGYIYKSDTNNSNIDHDTRLYYILKWLYREKNGNSPVTTNYVFDQSYRREDFTQIDVSDVENYYYNLYGVRKINHKTLNTSSMICPMFIYDDVNQKYYGAATCGGVSGSEIITYINKCTKTSNHLYVYVSLGVIEYHDEGGATIYKDYKKQNKYGDTQEQLADGKNNIITDNNYHDFSVYKYTFDKNSSGDYYFSSIKKISD